MKYSPETFQLSLYKQNQTLNHCTGNRQVLRIAHVQVFVSPVQWNQCEARTLQEVSVSRKGKFKLTNHIPSSKEHLTTGYSLQTQHQHGAYNPALKAKTPLNNGC